MMMILTTISTTRTIHTMQDQARKTLSTHLQEDMTKIEALIGILKIHSLAQERISVKALIAEEVNLTMYPKPGWFSRMIEPQKTVVTMGTNGN